MKVRQAEIRVSAIIEWSDKNLQRTFRYEGMLSGDQLVLTREDAASPEHVIGELVICLSTDLLR